MAQTQKFAGDYRSEQHQLNGNHFYGPVSFSTPHQRKIRYPFFTKDHRNIPRTLNDEEDHRSLEFGSGTSLSWDDCLQSLRSEELNDREWVIDRHTEGTCEWLLESPEYLSWIAEHGLLLIRGKPGSGKSTLLKFALERQLERAAISGSVVLSFFFYASGTELQNGIVGLFRSLLLQLLDQDDGSRPTFLDICRNRWITGGKKKLHMEWNEKELQVGLQKLVLECSARRKLTIFVDAIDECKDQDRDRVIRFFHTLKGGMQPRVRRPSIFFACRPYPDGQIDAEFYIRLEEKSQHDIESFVQQELRLLDETPEDEEALKNTLQSKADGLFLWLILIIPQVHDMNSKGLSFESIQSEILQCPQELNGLYEGLLRKIEDKELLEACSLFQWTCFSARPLSLDELRIAMNVQLSGAKESLGEYESQDNPHWIPNETKMRKRMIYLSRGLVEITNAKPNGGQSLIGFGHETIKDFMLNKGLHYLNERLEQSRPLAKDAYSQMANTCLCYLSTKEIRAASKGDETGLCAELWFLCYAATYWLSYAVLAEREECGEQIAWPGQDLLDIWIEVCKSYDYDLPQDFFEGTSLMHIAAKYGLISLAKRIVRQKPQQIGSPSKSRSMSWHKSKPTVHGAAQSYPRSRTKSNMGTTSLTMRPTERNNILRSTIDKSCMNSNERGGNLSISTGEEKAQIYKQNECKIRSARDTLQQKKAMADMKDKSGNLPLHLAAENGHLDMVTLLVEWGTDCNVYTANSNGWTPLNAASLDGHMGVVRYLYEHGADVDIHTATNNGWTPLHTASSYGHLEVVKFLYESGACSDIHAATKDGWTPLNAASSYGHLEVVKFLCEHGADADIHRGTDEGWTPIHTASSCGHLEVVRYLYEHGADAEVHTATHEGWTPLNAASLDGHFEVVKFLYEHGADIDIHIPTDDGWIPLISASRQGHLEVVKLLLEKDVNINITNDYGWTPLHAASFSGWTEISRLLLDEGAAINVVKKGGRTPLHDSSFLGHKEMVNLLLEKGADIHFRDHQNRTPLYLASHKGHLEVVNLLIEKGADITSKDENGMTPLDTASYSGHLGVAKLLLEKGAEIAVRNNLGMTPLYSASLSGYPELVKLLLERGADMTVTNHNGWTPLYAASCSRHTEVTKLLLQRGADVTASNVRGETPLHSASGNGHLDVVRLLLSSSPDHLGVRDILGRTPLFYATASGHLDVVEYMLLNNADVDAEDFYQLTPLSAAVINGHEEVVQHLIAFSMPKFALEDSLGRSMLWWATKTGKAKIIEIVRQYAQASGTTVLDSDLDVVVSATNASYVKGDRNSRTCDVCTRHILSSSSYQRCGACYDFGICVECFEMGGRCLNRSHHWFLHGPDIIPN